MGFSIAAGGIPLSILSGVYIYTLPPVVTGNCPYPSLFLSLKEEMGGLPTVSEIRILSDKVA